MVKYATVCKCKIKFWYFKYRYHETYYYIRMEEAIGQPKKN